MLSKFSRLESELTELRSRHHSALVELASLRTARARDEGEAEKRARAARAELEAERQHSRWDYLKNSCPEYPDVIIIIMANSRNLKQKLRQAHSEAADGTIVIPPPQSTRQRMAFEEAEEAKTGTRRKKRTSVGVSFD